MEEMEMSIVQEETTCSVQTQTDLTMEEIFDLESAKNSLKHAETKTNKKKMVSNFLVDQDIKDYDEFLEARDNSNDESDEDTNDNGSPMSFFIIFLALLQTSLNLCIQTLLILPNRCPAKNG